MFRVSLAVFAAIAVMIVGFVVFRHHALPRQVQWQGTISRIFVSGEALEVISADAPGGVFHAYMPEGQVSPVTDGTVTVNGLWRGSTCDYGTRCVPEVDIISVQ